MESRRRHLDSLHSLSVAKQEKNTSNSMASESPLLLGLDRDQWTLNLLRGTIQELVRENYSIELDQPWETRPVLMHRLDNLLRRLTPEAVNLLTERHRQRDWAQGDVVRNRGAARLIYTRAARHCATVRANRVQPQIRLNLMNEEPSLPAGTGVPNNEMRNPRTQSEVSLAAQVARTSQLLRPSSGQTNELRRRVLELEAANNGLMTRVSELEKAAIDQAIEKLILKDRTELLEATLATGNRQSLSNRVSMLEAAILSMQEENTRFGEGTVVLSESAVRELVEINGEKNDRWVSSRDALLGLDSDHREVQLLDHIVQRWDRAIARRNNQNQRERQ